MNVEYTYEVSVCITTYNMEKYIGRALKSVLVQKTDFNFEIIVTDDASTDATIEIVKDFQSKAGKEIKLLTAEANEGVTKNLAKALKASRGKYIALLDADDYWISANKLQLQVDHLNSHTETGYVYTNYYHENEETKQRVIAFANNYVHPDDKAYETMLTTNFIQPSNTCFRASLVDETRLNVFIENDFRILDYCLFLDFALRSRGAYLPAITTVYTHRQGSMSRENDYEKKVSNYLHSYKIGNYFIKQKPIDASLVNRRKFNYQFNLLMAAWQYGTYSDVKKQATSISEDDIKRYNPKALYVYYASRNRLLYTVVKPWLLRKRKFGK